MSRHSAFDKTTGQWGDIVWLSRPIPAVPPIPRYIVKVGPRTVGEVWPTRSGWVAISNAQGAALLGLRGVRGFATRWAATDYLLNVGVRPVHKDGEGDQS